jgi:hypothetical protein
VVCLEIQVLQICQGDVARQRPDRRVSVNPKQTRRQHREGDEDRTDGVEGNTLCVHEFFEYLLEMLLIHTRDIYGRIAAVVDAAKVRRLRGVNEYGGRDSKGRTILYRTHGGI